MNTFHSLDSYPLQVRLTAEAIAFLETKYLTEDPELGIVHLVNEAMSKAKRTAAARVQVLKHPAYAAPSASSSPSQNSPQQTPQLQVGLSDQSQTSANPIGALQEYCQQAELPLPEYQFETCAERFTCQVSAAEQSATGTGANKKTAKANAAALLGTLHQG